MYGDFASVYDRLQDADYNSFVDYYERIFEKFGLKPKLVLDLACGTGNITIPMAQRGYDMIGVDLSVEMLNIARGKAAESGQDILFLNQDMTEFELYGTVDAAVCALDGVNYLTEDGDLGRLFALVKNYLNFGGIMIFDINSAFKLKNILGNETFVNEEDGIFYVWQNFWEEERSVCCFELNFFEEQTDGSYLRFEEVQEERAYTVEEITAEAKRAGLFVEGVYKPFEFGAANEQCDERIFFVVSRKND